MLRKLLAIVAAAVLPLMAHAQAPAPDVTIRTEKVADGVYALFGKGGNIGLSVGSDGVFMIDDQYAPQTAAINRAVAALDPRPVRLVLNTHWHGDHTGGNANYTAAGALVIAQDEVRARMSTAQDIAFLDRKVPASPPAALPVATFSDQVTFYFNGDEIRAVHMPHAHTDGDTVVFFRKANVIHAGDIYFNGMYPFIDVDSGGSIGGVLAAVDRMLAASDAQTRIIPGHGPLATRADLEAYRRMLFDTTERVRKLRAAGKSVDEIVAAAPNADYDRTWSSNFINAERYVRMLYRAMDREQGK